MHAFTSEPSFAARTSALTAAARVAHTTRDTLTSFAPGAARSPVLPLAREPESPWEARGFGDLVPPATLAEARARKDDLARLLRREHEAAADFLLALADFDRRRGWERLGHAGLFAFLTRELGLSNSAAWYRQSAARLLPRFPAVEAALREGRLCLSVVGELSRVLTPENRPRSCLASWGPPPGRRRSWSRPSCPSRRRPGGSWSRRRGQQGAREEPVRRQPPGQRRPTGPRWPQRRRPSRTPLHFWRQK